jgi:NAD(P)-dependent dehydrogenase (short-subunit alcohol dehydrogenase family)
MESGERHVSTHQGRFAAVTGAGSGNGRAIAETLLEEGARVALLDIAPESLAALTDKHPEALAVTADVADAASVAQALETVGEAFGRLDILVNNAGIVRSSNFADLPVEEWNEVFAVNSTGPFLMSQAAMPLLRAGANARGDEATAAIVNITSVEAHIVISSSGHPQVHYNASKGALLQLTRALAVECAAERVRVNAVAPGFIETPFTRGVLSNPEVVSWLLERTPLGRVGQPADVANAVSFLGSDKASWITGTTLMVDGGWTVY